MKKLTLMTMTALLLTNSWAQDMCIVKAQVPCDQVVKVFNLESVQIADGRTILAEQSGLTAYTFDVDAPNQSNCHGGCLQTWPAITVSESDVLEAPFGKITRPDGTLQLTMNQMPLYTFVGDQVRGDINGDGLGGTWHIIEASSQE